MVSLDKEKNKRLKEARSLYEKSLKAFQKGDITKEELKERLRPYKYELKELGYPVKIRDDEPPASIEAKAVEPAPSAAELKEEQATDLPQLTIDIAPWTRRSQLTMDEVEKRIDTISLTKRPSEKLQSMYQSRYGEDLEPPLDLVPYTAPPSGPVQAEKGPGLARDAPEAGPVDDGTAKRPFWKGLFKGRRRA